MPSPFQIDVFHGQLSPHTAHVYARVGGLRGGQGWTISGRVRGPECRHAKSLAANHTFVDLGAGETLLAQATIPDPCFWSPDLPALYRLTVELRQREEVVQTAERELGLRFFGTRRNSFYLEGKRWVLRGMRRESVEPAPLADWRDVGAAMLVDDPSDELCREAAREGVFLVARATGDDMAVLRRLSQWASVGIVVSSSPSDIWTEARRQLPNLLVAHDAVVNCDGIPPESCSSLFLDAAILNSHRSRFAASSLPTVAVRQLVGLRSLADARSECDRLQSDLASLGDFAGYVMDRSRHAPP